MIRTDNFPLDYMNQKNGIPPLGSSIKSETVSFFVISLHNLKEKNLKASQTHVVKKSQPGTRGYGVFCHSTQTVENPAKQTTRLGKSAGSQ